jgi:transketolase
MPDRNLDNLCVNTLRFLCVDAVEKARSGHPGMPMGAAPMAYVLWDRFLKHNPRHPGWPDRDRFVLSAGHASTLLYALLYLTGYDLTLEDIKAFRQWQSKTPGHPEYRLTPGVEATTGPLGQGIANAVGMALAERHLAAVYNRPRHTIIDHYTYALVSDGDLEEGVSAEAASLAGNLKLGKMVCLYDSNSVQQDGPTVSFTENVAQRFRAYGWRVIGPIDGMDVEAVDQALRAAKARHDRPTLIIGRTVIGFGSPLKAGTNAAHSDPMGPEEVRLAKENLHWPYTEPFTIPQEALDHYRTAVTRGQRREEEWERRLSAYEKAYPEEVRRLTQSLAGELPAGWDAGLDEVFKNNGQALSTRDASGMVLNYLADWVPALMGGAADLAGSTRAYLKGLGDISPADYSGRNIRFGLREHAMGAISSGLALHGGVIPFAGTFLVFADYLRPSMRLAAIMGLRVIYIFTHDSIAVGEDGPTHQPVEQVASLRAMPGLVALRPADAWETRQAWRIALERTNGPTALILTRQNVPNPDAARLPADGVARGGYIRWEAGGQPAAILIASGSEVHLAVSAGQMLQSKGVPVRVVSLPAWSLFDTQPEEYRNTVLPHSVRVRLAVEAGAPLGWERYTGLDGVTIGVAQFGKSAPGEVVYKQMGFTPEHIVEAVMKLRGGSK